MPWLRTYSPTKPTPILRDVWMLKTPLRGVKFFFALDKHTSQIANTQEFLYNTLCSRHLYGCCFCRCRRFLCHCCSCIDCYRRWLVCYHCRRRTICHSLLNIYYQQRAHSASAGLYDTRVGHLEVFRPAEGTRFSEGVSAWAPKTEILRNFGI